MFWILSRKKKLFWIYLYIGHIFFSFTWMPFYLLFLFLNIAVNNPCTNYPSTSRTDSENNNSLKLRQLQSHLLSPKLAVSFSRDRCIYHIHNHSKMKSSTKGTPTPSFSSRRVSQWIFQVFKKRISRISVFEGKPKAQRSWLLVSRYSISIQTWGHYVALKTAFLWHIWADKPKHGGEVWEWENGLA